MLVSRSTIRISVTLIITNQFHFLFSFTQFFSKKKMNFQSVSNFLCMRMFKTILYISNDNIVKKINYSDVSQFVVGILLDFFLHIIKISYFIVKKLQAHSTAVVIEIEVKLSNQRRFRLILCAKYVCWNVRKVKYVIKNFKRVRKKSIQFNLWQPSEKKKNYKIKLALKSFTFFPSWLVCMQ